MAHHPPPYPLYPFEPPRQLADMLREQELAPDELNDLLPTAHRLAEWRVPAASPADTQRLLTLLAPQVLGQSPVRQAVYTRVQRQDVGLFRLLEMARTQVSLFGLSFWLVSALVTLLGGVVVLGNMGFALSTQEALLRASGPLLAYLGAVVAFRGTGQHVLEFELVCPTTPAQLAMARLVIVLGYDVVLGLALGLALWAGGVEQTVALTLSWFMPLLLVAGLALLLSLRLSTQVAAAIAYGSWLAVLALGAAAHIQAPPLMPVADVLAGALGAALLTIALSRLHSSMSNLLPHT